MNIGKNKTVFLFAAFLVGAGYKGLLVFIDELVNIFKIPNSITRANNHEKILTMYNDVLQGKAKYIGFSWTAPSPLMRYAA